MTKAYYDWEKICKTKSNKELYEVYTRRSNLPELAIPYAKKELEKRNFDFNSMKVNRTAWRLTDLLVEEENDRTDYTKAKREVKLFKYIPFGLAFMVLVTYLIWGHESFMERIMPYAVGASVTLLVMYFSYISRFKRRRKRQETIRELVNFLKSNNEDIDIKPVISEVGKEAKAFSKKIKETEYVLAIITLLIALFTFIISYDLI